MESGKDEFDDGRERKIGETGLRPRGPSGGLRLLEDAGRELPTKKRRPGEGRRLRAER
jgi:hypothetical protein